MNKNTSNISFTFFGSSHMSVIVLDELKSAGYIPTCIVTTPDKPQGRKLILTPNVVKTWAHENNIPVYDPAKLDTSFIETFMPAHAGTFNLEPSSVFIVASYGKIIPQAVLDIPARKTLNIHPSLLPLYRGASPLQSAMLDDQKKTGVSIMRIDAEMDHGPLIAQKEIIVQEWPTYEVFEENMAREGARILADILPDWISGAIKEKEQDHSRATYTKKFTKADALIDLSSPDQYLTFRKIQAFHERPQAYFMITHNGKEIRIKVTQASFKNNALVIEKVIPEGGKEMGYADFESGYKKY
ncbi:MAG: methionyl-tRNA formyltransferase [Candidatus Taylorbacteria bacterium]